MSNIRKTVRINHYVGNNGGPLSTNWNPSWVIDTSEYSMETIARVFVPSVGTAGPEYKPVEEIKFSFHVQDQELTLIGFDQTDITIMIDFYSLKEERRQKIEKILKE